MNLNLLDQYEKELYDYMCREAQLLPFANRLRTRLIVTNSLEAHLSPTAPNDVAVYYYVPGILDVNQLRVWRIAILHNWISHIDSRGLSTHVGGMWNGLLNPTPGLLSEPLARLSQAEEDIVYNAGYNLIKFHPGFGYVIWGTTLWRDGVPKIISPVGPRYDDPAYWSNLASPIALVY